MAQGNSVVPVPPADAVDAAAAEDGNDAAAADVVPAAARAAVDEGAPAALPCECIATTAAAAFETSRDAEIACEMAT